MVSDGNCALTCDCGSVSFALLRTGFVECIECQRKINNEDGIGIWGFDCTPDPDEEIDGI